VDETIVALPVPLRPVSQVRASILLVSLQALGRRGLAEEYRRKLPESEHAAMFSLAGAGWVPRCRGCEEGLAATPAGTLPSGQILTVGRV
jgi:hypothetical protein